MPNCSAETVVPLEIHGYMETLFKTAHITPRGLVIADKGVEIQPVGALSLDLYKGNGLVTDVLATAGVWNSVNSSMHNGTAGPWFEIDYFAKINLLLAKRVNFSMQYIAFDSPDGAFQTDNNLEFTLNYNDTGMLAPDVGIRPYARLFYNIDGSSTVLLGRNGSTFDAELGLIPTYTWKAIPNYPITFSLPTYVTVGPATFWGGTANVGVFTTSLGATVPLSFIPRKYGTWHLDAGVSYFNLINGQLRDAAGALGTGRDRNRVVGTMGIGFDF
jgi:hypothetical protein